MGSNCCQPASTDVETVASLAGETTGTGIETYASEQGTLGFLSRVKLFQRLPIDLLPVLATACKKKEFCKSSIIIQQADYGSEFYIIVSGTVSVNIDDHQVTTFGVGDYFGEMALLRDEPRSATIIAEDCVQALVISREKFQEMGLAQKLDFKKRLAIGGGGGRKVTVQPPTNKSDADRTLIRKALQSNRNLSELLGSLDDTKIQQIADIAWEQTVRAGHNLIEQGADGDYFYMVKEGSFEIFVATRGEGGKGAGDAEVARSERVGTVGKGFSFGELALLYLAPRAATVKAREKSVVWVIDRYNFKKTLTKAADDDAKEYVKYLETKDIFMALSSEDKRAVAKALLERNFAADECVFFQGEEGTSFFILVEGEVAVVKDGVEVIRLSGTPSKVEIFGEKALLNAESRAATIKAVTDIRTLSLDKASFDFLLGPLKEIQSHDHLKSHVAKVKGRSNVGGQPIRRKDLLRMGLLGSGGFGCVEIVEHKETKETFALKALNKGHIVKLGMQTSVMKERDIQLMCNNNFIIQLFETYDDAESFYFLLELAIGGELYGTYARKGFHGSTKHAQFYISGVTFAFDHMHEKMIIYRDLKPENLLLTERGGIKVADMGLAKVVVGKTYTTCGTPDYFAPEMIASTGHTHAIDWWALGVLTFELMTGHPPFESAAPLAIYNKVKKGISTVLFPLKIKGPCEDFIKALCAKDPADRLPMKRGGIDNVRFHQWYKNFEWSAMRQNRLKAPYIPKVKNKKDIANFTARIEDIPPQLQYHDDGSGWDKDFSTSH